MKPPNESVLLPARKSKTSLETNLKKIGEAKRKNEKFNRKVNELENCSKSQITHPKSRQFKLSIPKKDSGKNSEDQLIPSPKTPKDPENILKKSLILLKCSQHKESVLALREIVQISRFNPQLLNNFMPIIYKGITTLLKSVRVEAKRTACQAANELFINIAPVHGSELEDLIHTLLEKTVESNKLVMNDALEALDSMILHISPSYSAKVLLHKKITGFNLAARTTAAKLLVCIANIINCEPGTKVNDDIKTKMVTAAVKFLQDDCSTIRMHGIRLVSFLMEQQDFNRILENKLTISTIKKINEVLQVSTNELEH